MFKRCALILLCACCLVGWPACANDRQMIEKHQQAIDAEDD